jgi:hypothetical protein
VSAASYENETRVTIEGSERHIPGCIVEVSISSTRYLVQGDLNILFYILPPSHPGTVDSSKKQFFASQESGYDALAALQKKHTHASSQVPRHCPIMSHEAEVFTLGLTITLPMLFEIVVQFYTLET